MKHYIAASMLVALLLSCEKKVEGPQGEAGPQGTSGVDAPINTGTISGRIFQRQESGMTYTTNLNTTTVSIAGTTISTVSDATGSYSLTEVPAGVYDLIFKKPTTRNVKLQQVNFPGRGHLIVNNTIIDKSTFQFISGYGKDTMTNQPSLKIVLKYSNVNITSNSMLVLFGKTPAIDPEDVNTYETTNGFSINTNSTSVQFVMPYNTFQFNSNFTKGSQFYARVYALSPGPTGMYTEVFTNKPVYPTAGDPFPTTFTFTMP